MVCVVSRFCAKWRYPYLIQYFCYCFVLGVTIGSNRLIVDNLFSFGWQAALLALSATVGSILASWLVLKLFFTSKKKKV